MFVSQLQWAKLKWMKVEQDSAQNHKNIEGSGGGGEEFAFWT